jgi:hypothetical protein
MIFYILRRKNQPVNEIFKQFNTLHKELQFLEEVVDKVVVNRLFSYYKLESKMRYDEGGEELGLDYKLLDSIEELVKYIGTKEEISEFNLQFKNK